MRLVRTIVTQQDWARYYVEKKRLLKKRRKYYPQQPLSSLPKKFLIKRDQDAK